jgi:chromosome partitioning protein
VNTSTLAFVNQKGGTGKSKTVLGSAPELAALERRVLVIDADPQATVTNALLGRGHDVVGLAEVLGAGNIPEEKRPLIDDLVISVKEFKVDLLAANFHRLSVLETEHTNDSSRVVDLNYALASITKPYDYILIDTPGNLGSLVMGSIMAVNYVVVVIDSGTEAVEGFATLQSALKRAARISDFEVLGVISTRYKSHTDLSKTVFDSVKQATSYRMYTTIRESTKIGSMNELRRPIGEIAKGRPEHLDFINVAKTIDELTHETSFIAIEKPLRNKKQTVSV